MWDAVPLLQSYGRRAPSGGQGVEEGRRENKKEGDEVTENLLDIDPLENMVRLRDDVFKCRRIKKEKLQRISRRVVDTTEAMSGVVVNACYFQDHTAPSYLNELIRHGQLLME
ncbi:hypothetical protein IGI04_012223 [Brassica rapa subsp. trilocularis]|uniref:Uncharacterized protein n=2 Tax=Brassica TaxID=3705 RepID=A0ABQ8DEF9_BRANA|nr:hypothetical protein IGI04_012223 [Brassica rapa subsp. trilocularis]KAH0927752.1 hypothetical protein HID58_020008 [Brassica napus]